MPPKGRRLEGLKPEIKKKYYFQLKIKQLQIKNDSLMNIMKYYYLMQTVKNDHHYKKIDSVEHLIEQKKLRFSNVYYLFYAKKQSFLQLNVVLCHPCFVECTDY